MAFEVTHIAKIYNFSGQRIEALQMQANGSAVFDSGKSTTVNWPIPWVNSPQDMDGHAPHLIRITLLGTGGYVLIWQHNDLIMQGLNYHQVASTAPHPKVGGWKDLVLRKTNIEIHDAGTTHYNVGPAKGSGFGVSWPD